MQWALHLSTPHTNMHQHQHQTAAGAKLAGLYYSAHISRPDVKAAYLIDPVDAPIDPEDRCIALYPAANASSFPNLAHALSNANAPLAIAAANITSKCNCNTSNYQELWPVAANQSWLAVLHEAGHLQLADDSLEFCNQESVIARWILRAVFTDPSKVPLVGRYLKDWACTAGKLGTGEAMDLVTQPMIAWLDKQVKVRGSVLCDFHVVAVAFVRRRRKADIDVVLFLLLS